MAWNGDEVAIPGSATSISSLLSITDPASKAYKQIHLTAVGAANCFVGGSNVTTSAHRRAIISTASTIPVVIGAGDNQTLNTDTIFVIGTAAGGNNILIGLVS